MSATWCTRTAYGINVDRILYGSFNRAQNASNTNRMRNEHCEPDELVVLKPQGPCHFCRTCGRAVTGAHAVAGHYVWYSLQLNVSEAPPIGSLDVSATVRQAVAVQVQISNPLHDALTFDLTYGSDQLVGPEVLALKPKESREFEFFFAPLVEGDSQASVTFSSFRVSLTHISTCLVTPGLQLFVSFCTHLVLMLCMPSCIAVVVICRALAVWHAPSKLLYTSALQLLL